MSRESLNLKAARPSHPALLWGAVHAADRNTYVFWLQAYHSEALMEDLVLRSRIRLLEQFPNAKLELHRG